ncbi:MAG TPA: hypothetical protein ENO08_00200 [Candidatus Eisenbacteria bacterium]|uniref:Tetratricopeptide repeat protein n=1 Tax=Eiseniibacteriota bacterium TaxID=2212470 RepID=A0A7V2ATA7_UNCEI|nr:hypothetical protein [Candidatus Eisenbacteria bacterium]
MRDGTHHTEAKPPFSFLSRYIPLALIAVLLVMLLPQLLGRRPALDGEPIPEPPAAFTIYRTSYTGIDSLGNEGLRRFEAGDWNGAVRLLGEAHFHYTVMIREGFAEGYPEDLRFYLGLSQYYRGRAEEGIALLEEEAEGDPLEPKYHWYLGLIRLAAGDSLAGREHLERVSRLDGYRAGEAREILAALPEWSGPDTP